MNKFTSLTLNKDIKKLLVLAILVRILIMPFYFHPDIKTYSYQTSFLRQGVFNIYSFINNNGSKLALNEQFVYFPLTYFVLGGYQAIISPLLGNNFNSWLSDASVGAINTIGLYRYLFLLKLPYLLLDLGIGLLLMKLVEREKQKQVLTLWLFNPFTILIIYVFSNVDTLPVLLSLVSLLLAQKRKWVFSALILGIAAGFKAYPLIFLPFIVMAAPTIKERIYTLMISLGVFLLILLPFLFSPGFSQAALVSGLTTRIFDSNIGLGFGEYLYSGIIALSLVFFYFLLQGQKFHLTQRIGDYFLVVLLILFSFIHFHIQWLLWMMPFLIILVTQRKSFYFPVILLLLCAVLIPFLYDDNFMSVSLFSGLSSLYNLLPTPFSVLQKIYSPFILQSILHSLFVGGSLLISWKVLTEEKYATD